MDCIEDHTEDCSVDCSLLRNISSYIFFISAASLSPWATRPGCFSRFINFFSSSFIFYLTTNLRGNLFGLSMLILRHKEKNLKQTWIQFLSIHFLTRLQRRSNVFIRQLEKPQETFEISLCTCFKCGRNNVFSFTKQVKSAMRERLYSTSAEIATINGEADYATDI